MRAKGGALSPVLRPNPTHSHPFVRGNPTAHGYSPLNGERKKRAVLRPPCNFSKHYSDQIDERSEQNADEVKDRGYDDVLLQIPVRFEQHSKPDARADEKP